MKSVTERRAESKRPRIIERPKPLNDVSFAKLNKNLCNYPLARDRHVHMKWRRFTDTGERYVDLPGDDRIRLILPADVDRSFERCPSAFDINVLAMLSAEANRQDRAEIAFPNRVKFLSKLKLAPTSFNRRRLDEALDYWATITVQFYKCWYDAARQRQASRDFAPPIQKLSPARSRPFVVQLSTAWRQILRGGYFEIVPLPLPADAVTQNLVLTSLVSHTRAVSGKYENSFQRQLRSYCRKIGLDHNNRRQRLERAIAAAQQWYAQHTGSLDAFVRDGMISFMVAKPMISKAARKELLPSVAAKFDRFDDAAPVLWAAPKTPKNAPSFGRRRDTTTLPKSLLFRDEDGVQHETWQFPNGVYRDWSEANERERELISQAQEAMLEDEFFD